MSLSKEAHSVLRWHSICTDPNCDFEHYSTSNRRRRSKNGNGGIAASARARSLEHVRETGHTVILKRIEQLSPVGNERLTIVR